MQPVSVEETRQLFHNALAKERELRGLHEGLCQQDLGKRALGFPTVRKKEKGGAGAHETRAEGQLSEPAQRGAEATTEGRLKSWHILLEHLVHNLEAFS